MSGPSAGPESSRQSSTSPLYFVDLEASSLSAGSFPIEIAWVDANGIGESHLIRPHAEWLADGCPGWSRESEAVHGISLEVLIRDGEPIEQVAARAAAVLSAAGSIVCSDAPGFDGPWLQALFRYGETAATFNLLDVREIYGQACRQLLDLLAGLEGRVRELASQRVRRVATELIGRAEEQEERRPRDRHRALPDADGLWRTWQAVRTAVTERVAEGAGALSAGRPLFLATRRDRPVVVDLATASEVAALNSTIEPNGVRDVLSPWSLIAIRTAGTGEPALHALGWREAEENTWITSALVTVDLTSSLILTSSGHVYRLGEGGAGLGLLLLDHLDYALRAWGFRDVR